MKILNKYLQFELKLEDYLTGVPNKKTFKDIIILKAQNIVFRELVNIPLNQALQAAWNKDNLNCCLTQLFTIYSFIIIDM